MINKIKETKITEENKFINLIKDILKWVLLSILMAVPTGLVVGYYNIILTAANKYRKEHEYLIYLLPLAGIAITFMYLKTKRNAYSGENLLKSEVQSAARNIPFYMTFVVFLGSLLTTFCGGSAGKEGSAVAMGGTLGDFIARKFKLSDAEQRTLVICGVGIDFKEANNYKALPFNNDKFDIIINRHGDYDVHELYRILKPGGIFITEQVGEDNDRELVELLLPGTPKPFCGLNLADQKEKFLEEGFSILKADEAFRPIQFFDIGALVWFAKIIQWEFPGFSVDKCFNRLLEAQKILNNNGSVDGMIHRYLIVACK